MIVLGVDLAARYSAACLLGPGGEVLDVFGSAHGVGYFDLPWPVFLERLSRFALGPGPFPGADVVVVEDLPHSLAYNPTTKAVSRLQGEIVETLRRAGVLDRLVFVPPARWQRGFAAPGTWRGTTAVKARTARAVAECYGFVPPDLIAEHHQRFAELHGAERTKVREALRKTEYDMVDAFLIATWAAWTLEEEDAWDDRELDWYLLRSARPSNTQSIVPDRVPAPTLALLCHPCLVGAICDH